MNNSVYYDARNCKHKVILAVDSVVKQNTEIILFLFSCSQEGSRYNALHVAAKARNAEICSLILQTVGNVAFIQLLYGDDDDDDDDDACCKDRAHILVDLYLNTPDKGLNETPLHFAVKFGSPSVVDVLVSYPQCDKNAKNKFGQAPRDVSNMCCHYFHEKRLTFRYRASSILGQAFRYSPENAFYIFNQQIYFII